MSPLHRPLNTVQPDLGSARPGWDGDDLLALSAEAGRKGIFDPQSNVRGRGGWKAQDKFIWHNGKMLFSVDVKTEAKRGRAQAWNLQATRPGEFDGLK